MVAVLLMFVLICLRYYVSLQVINEIFCSHGSSQNLFSIKPGTQRYDCSSMCIILALTHVLYQDAENQNIPLEMSSPITTPGYCVCPKLW